MGYLPETCVCRVCQSQLDWREIPGCGPDCTGASAPAADEAASEAPDSLAVAPDVEGGPPRGGEDGGSAGV